MAGHSQFANIKHRKGAQDAKRSKLFTKIQREITSSIRYGGDASEEFNPRLRLAILKAKSCNMPKDKIEAAIKKATGVGEGDNFEEIRYDIHAPAGVGIIVEALTDNRNRTAGEVRAITAKFGGNMGETGSLDFAFKRIGVILYQKNDISFDELFEKSAELGVESVEEYDEVFEITTTFADFHKIQADISKMFGNPMEASLQYRSLVSTVIPDDKKTQIENIIDALEDLDDVQNVWSAI